MELVKPPVRIHSMSRSCNDKTFGGSVPIAAQNNETTSRVRYHSSRTHPEAHDSRSSRYDRRMQVAHWEISKETLVHSILSYPLIPQPAIHSSKSFYHTQQFKCHDENILFFCVFMDDSLSRRSETRKVIRYLYHCRTLVPV